MDKEALIAIEGVFDNTTFGSLKNAALTLPESGGLDGLVDGCTFTVVTCCKESFK